MRSHLAAFTRAVPWLSKLSSHEALFLIKNSLAIPKLQYVLRTAPCFLATSLTDFDNAVFQTLTSCINVALLCSPFRLSCIRDSFFISGHSAFATSFTILPGHHFLRCLIPVAGRGWLVHPRSGLGRGFLSTEELGRASVCTRCTSHLLWVEHCWQGSFSSWAGQGSGSWLLALLSASLGLRLSNEETRVAVGLRLGSRLVRGHKCICGVNVQPDGRHGLACRHSAGRHARHSK